MSAGEPQGPAEGAQEPGPAPESEHQHQHESEHQPKQTPEPKGEHQPKQTPEPKGEHQPKQTPEPKGEPERAPSAAHPASDEKRGAQAHGPPRQGQERLPSGLFQRLRLARQALTVVRGYSFFGTILAAGIYAASYPMYEAALPRWICRLGAMGTLLGAVVGLNVMDRLVRGRYLPTKAVVFGLALIAVALLGVGVGAVRYQLGAAWSPLAAATYVVVGVRIFLRIQSPSAEAAG